MKDLNEAGSVFGCTRMHCENRDFKIANGLVEIMNSEFKRKVQMAEEMLVEMELPILTGRHIAFMICAFKVSDVQR